MPVVIYNRHHLSLSTEDIMTAPVGIGGSLHSAKKLWGTNAAREVYFKELDKLIDKASVVVR